MHGKIFIKSIVGKPQILSIKQQKAHFKCAFSIDKM